MAAESDNTGVAGRNLKPMLPSESAGLTQEALAKRPSNWLRPTTPNWSVRSVSLYSPGRTDRRAIRSHQKHELLVSTGKWKNRDRAFTRDSAKVPVVERRDSRLSAFCAGDNRGVGNAKREVVVTLDKRSNAFPIVEATVQFIGAPLDVSGKRGYRYLAKVAFDKMRNLREDRDGHDERAGMRSKRTQDSTMLKLPPVERGKESRRVDDYQSCFQFSAFQSSSLSAGMCPLSAMPNDSGQSGSTTSASVYLYAAARMTSASETPSFRAIRFIRLRSSSSKYTVVLYMNIHLNSTYGTTGGKCDRSRPDRNNRSGAPSSCTTRLYSTSNHNSFPICGRLATSEPIPFAVRWIKARAE